MKIVFIDSFRAVWVLMLLLPWMYGCKTNAEVRHELAAREMREQPQLNPFIQGSSNPIVGSIIWVDPQGQRAVVQLKSRVIEALKPLVSRNRSNEPTALLQPGKQRRDATLGVTIAYGRPQIGDEVILREATQLPEAWGYAPTPDVTAGTSGFPFVLPKDKQAFTNDTQFIRKTNTKSEQPVNAEETVR